MSQFKELKQIAYESNMDIPKYNLAIYTFGNVSAIDREKGVVAIKPSGVAYSDLKVEDMVIVDLDFKIVEGSMRPSSDTKTHIVLYNNFPTIGGVAHTHSMYAVSWAQALRAIPIYGTTHADHVQGDIPITKVMSDEMIQGDYELETGNQILDTFKDLSYEEVQMVLVASHGPFTWGETATKAVYNNVVLEELAKMALNTETINTQVKPMKDSLIQKHYQRKHGKDAYYGQE
ncbi:MAG: L-ribulose-5-phosphate 4-epimerase [Planctomycetota bacterium]|nr:MAG: L-ribulose-5-phosphate 4-epimerase [Planctomycetota bacterium]